MSRLWGASILAGFSYCPTSPIKVTRFQSQLSFPLTVATDQRQRSDERTCGSQNTTLVYVTVGNLSFTISTEVSYRGYEKNMVESLLAHAPIGIAVLGANGYFIATYGRLNEFITSGRHRTVFDITPRHLHARLRQQLKAVKRTGHMASLQIPLYDKERNIKWMQLTIENASSYNVTAYLMPIDQYKSLQEMMIVLGSEPVMLEHMLKEVAGLLNCNAISIIRADGVITALWKDGELRCSNEFKLAPSPWASVLRKRDIIYIPMHVQTFYPQDMSLNAYGVQGYFGLPIMDNGDVLGVMSVMSRNALIIDDLHVAILRLFAMRAAGVLRYNEKDSEICPELETHG